MESTGSSVARPAQIGHRSEARSGTGDRRGKIGRDSAAQRRARGGLAR
jgi:hypothetical protein